MRAAGRGRRRSADRLPRQSSFCGEGAVSGTADQTAATDEIQASTSARSASRVALHLRTSSSQLALRFPRQAVGRPHQAPIDFATRHDSAFVPKQGVIRTTPAVGPAEEKLELAGGKRLTSRHSFASHARGRWFEPSRAHSRKPCYGGVSSSLGGFAASTRADRSCWRSRAGRCGGRARDYGPRRCQRRPAVVRATQAASTHVQPRSGLASGDGDVHPAAAHRAREPRAP